LRKILLTLLCLLVLVSCEKSEVQILQERLDNFRNILPQELRAEFDSKKYDEVTRGIDSLFQSVPAFKENFERIKHDELIDIFSNREVVDFFREYFAEKIERMKKK
jgi:hypothetical protein